MAPAEPISACNEIAALIEPCVDGDLGEQAALRVAEHLAECGSCRASYDAATSIKDALRRLPAMRCPDHVMHAVMAQAGAIPRPVNRHWRAWSVTALAAAAAFAIVLTAWQSPEPQTAQPNSVEPLATPVDLAQSDQLNKAEAQIKWTLAYIGNVNRRNADSLQGHLAATRFIRPASETLSILLNADTQIPAARKEI